MIDADIAQRIGEGEKFRDARIDARITLRELASMAGLEPRELSDFENGRLGITAHNAVELKLRLTNFGHGVAWEKPREGVL